MRTLDTGVGSGIGGALLAGSAPALTAFPPVSARGGGVSTSRGSFGTLCARRRAVVLRFGAPARPGVGIGRRGAAVPARAASSSRLGAKRARARACGAVVDTPAALCRLRRGADGLHCHRRLQGRLGRPADARLVHTDLWRRLEPRGARTVGGHEVAAGRVRPPPSSAPARIKRSSGPGASPATAPRTRPRPARPPGPPATPKRPPRRRRTRPRACSPCPS